MLKTIPHSEQIFYVGADDKTLDLFESQYPVPDGVSYNAYVIRDEKTALLDTVDPRATNQWLEQVTEVLDGTAPDYLVISHMEPDHAGSIRAITEHYPDMTLVGSAKALGMLPQFLGDMPGNPTRTVKEGETLELGSHTLHFVMAPMVHWPEVMVCYESGEKVLFSADAFGKFGALDTDQPWTDEARRYYLNIVGKYGAPVQTLLKKAAKLDIRTICPLHGPVLTGDLAPYLEKYQTWSSYAPEEKGVLVAYASIHGNTAQAAALLAEQLKALGETVGCWICPGATWQRLWHRRSGSTGQYWRRQAMMAACSCPWKNSCSTCNTRRSRNAPSPWWKTARGRPVLQRKCTRSWTP